MNDENIISILETNEFICLRSGRPECDHTFLRVNVLTGEFSQSVYCPLKEMNIGLICGRGIDNTSWLNKNHGASYSFGVHILKEGEPYQGTNSPAKIFGVKL